MGKRRYKYSCEEAKARIPLVARRVALEAVDLLVILTEGERGVEAPYPINSREVEHRVWALTGQVGYLSRLIHIVWRHDALEQLKAQGVE